MESRWNFRPWSGGFPNTGASGFIPLYITVNEPWNWGREKDLMLDTEEEWFFRDESPKPTKKMSSWGRSAFYYEPRGNSILSHWLLHMMFHSVIYNPKHVYGTVFIFFKFTGQLGPCSDLVGPVSGQLQFRDSELQFHSTTLSECSRGPSVTLSSWLLKYL